jgi:hypothetical protein
MRHTDRSQAARVLAIIGLAIFVPAGAVLADPPASREALAALPAPVDPTQPSATAAPTLRATPTPEPAATPRRIAPPTATPTPDPTPTPEPTPALDPPPRPGAFALDLYRRGDFVSQATVDWCVPASIQTMMRMIDGATNRQLPTQRSLDRLARALSTDRLRGPGSEPEGWAGALNEHGYGPYVVRALPTRAAAYRAAATALRLTGRPVGLLMWRGAHAWVMSGFKATADPAYTANFRVTHLFVSDAWYPRLSSTWGRSRPPDSLVPVGTLTDEYLPWRRPHAPYVEKDGRFVLVLPVAPAS